MWWTVKHQDRCDVNISMDKLCETQRLLWCQIVCVCVCHYYKLTKHSAENKVTFSDKHPGPGFVPRTTNPVSKPSLKQHIKLKSWTFQLIMQLIASGNWFIINAQKEMIPFITMKWNTFYCMWISLTKAKI